MIVNKITLAKYFAKIDFPSWFSSQICSCLPWTFLIIVLFWENFVVRKSPFSWWSHSKKFLNQKGLFHLDSNFRKNTTIIAKFGRVMKASMIKWYIKHILPSIDILHGYLPSLIILPFTIYLNLPVSERNFGMFLRQGELFYVL